MIKRQLLDIDSHPAFKTVKNLRMMSDIWMYKNLKECHAIFKEMSPRSRSKISKDEMKDLRLAELSDLI